MRTADLLAVPLVAFEAARPTHTHPYQLILGIVPIHAVENHAVVGNGEPTSRLAIAIEVKQEIEWKTSSNVIQFGDSARTSLLPVLRFESHGGGIEIKPRRHSLSIGWRIDFH